MIFQCLEKRKFLGNFLELLVCHHVIAMISLLAKATLKNDALVGEDESRS